MHRVPVRSTSSIRLCARRGTLIGAPVLLLLAGAISAPGAQPQTYTEEFTTTAFKDAVQTTAEWDTAGAQLTLRPLVQGVIGSYATPGASPDVQVDGDLAVVADGLEGVLLIDLGDPESPQLLGTIDTPGYVHRLAIDGDHVFVADHLEGMHVLDITDPTNPVLLGTYDTPGEARDVVVAGDLAFVADWTEGLVILDVTDPASPAHVATLPTSDRARGVAVSGDIACVADATAGVMLVDISEPSIPLVLGSVDTPGFARSIAIEGDLVYVADGGNGGLQVIDITDPASPVLIGGDLTPGSGQDVVVSGDRACVADQDGGLLIFDVTDPSNPLLEITFGTPGRAFGVDLEGGIAYVADETGGLLAILIDDAYALSVESQVTPGLAHDVVAAGDHAFVADGDAGLQVFDISDPDSPVLIGSHDTPGFAWSLAVAGDHAWVADRSGGLAVIDISDPSNPVLAGTFVTPDQVYDVEVAGDHAYVAADDSGLLILDVTDPANPVQVGTYPVPAGTGAVTVAGDLGFVAEGSAGRLHVIDISDVTNPVLLSNTLVGFISEMVAAGDLLAVAGATSGLSIVDVRDPTNPVVLAIHVPSDPPYSIAVAGNHVFAGGLAGGLEILDITDATQPVLASSVQMPGGVHGIAVAGDRAFVAGEQSGLVTVLSYQDQIYRAGRNTGQSLSVNGATGLVVRTRLVSTETGGIAWNVTADGGASWMEILPDGEWLRLDMPGDDLRWRTTHIWSPGGPLPTVTELTLDWLTAAGPITSITDIPGDQGGWVRLGFSRSGYDFAEETETPVTGYQVLRRVDDPGLRQAVLGSPAATDRARRPGRAWASFEPGSVHRLRDRLYVHAEDGSQGILPPGLWESVAWVAAQQAEDYVAAIPTLADSTAAGGTAWSVHVVTTHTTTPSVWFASAPDSGYSVDNLAPGAPMNLLFGQPTVLIWDPAPEPDFQYHSVYGSASPVLDPTATLIVQTVDPTHDVGASPFPYYHVTTSDHAGNESEAASIQNSSISVERDPAPPRIFRLLGASPNPMRSTTTIAFDLPEPARTRLSIYDVHGRRVRVVNEGVRPAGRHAIDWDARDTGGRRVPAGVYFARLEAGPFEAEQRLVIVR